MIAYPYDLVAGILKQADLELRNELHSSDWFTKAAYLLQLIPNGILGWIILPVNLVVAIPRMMLWVMPGLKHVFILANQLIYMAILGPVVGTSILWYSIVSPAKWALRPAIILVGVPFAILGNLHSSLALMGGPDEHGANKNYKMGLFMAWPLTASYRRMVKASIDELGVPNLLFG